MNYLSGKRFKFQELDRDVLQEQLDHQLGIYVWSLRPTVTSVADIGAILSKSTFYRRIKGKDLVSSQELHVTIDKPDVVSQNYSLSMLEDNPIAVSAFSGIASYISPPLYIGKSKQLNGRILTHKGEIRKAFSAHQSSSENSHFATFLRKYGQTLKASQLINRELTPSDLQVTIFTLNPLMVSLEEVDIIEIGLIALFAPPGNKKIL